MDLPPSQPRTPAEQLDQIHSKAATVIEDLLDFDCKDAEANIKARVVGVNLALQLLKQSGWSASSKNVGIAALVSKVPDREALERLMSQTPD